MASSPQTRSTPPTAPALNWAFLERTVRSTVVTASLVALSVSVYHSIPVGARYLFFALWALSFFTATGMIFKYMLFNTSRIKGLSVVVAKLGLLVLVYAVLFGWPIPGSEHERAHMIAMVAGVTTPLVVLVLRALSWAMDQNRLERRRGTRAAAPGQADHSGPQTGAEFQMQA